MLIKYIRCIFLFIAHFIFWGIDYSFAQQYNIKHFTVKDGLAQSQVFSIFQDINGYLWFGTGGGLCKYDGVKFIAYSSKQGMTTGSIRTIYQDKADNLWFGTYGGGVCKLVLGKAEGYNGNSFQCFTSKEDFAGNIVRAIFEDNNNSIWFATDGGGVSKYNNGIFTNYSTENVLRSNRVWTIAADKDDSLWIGTLGAGVYKYNGKTFVQFDSYGDLVNANVWSIYLDKDKNLWFATDKGLIKYFSSSDKNVTDSIFTYTQKNGLSGNNVRSIFQDSNGNLWVGTNGNGLNKFDTSFFKLTFSLTDSLYKKFVTHYNTSNGLSHNIILSVCEDREGNMWVGTNGGGVNKLEKSPFVHLTEKNGLSSNNIWSIVIDKNDMLWFGTNDNGVNVYDTRISTVNPITHITVNEGLINNRIWSLLEDHAGNIWFGTDAGLSKFDGKKYYSYTTSTSLCNNSCLSLFEDKENNIWIGSYGGGVSKFTGNKISCLNIKDGLCNNTVWSIFQDHHGYFWFGTDGGVSKYDGKTFYNLTTENGLTNNTVLTILEDKENHIWLGTYGGGIIKIDNLSSSIDFASSDNFEKITSKNGLSDDLVLSMIVDDNGLLWIGTYKGIDKFDLNTYKNTGEKKIEHYGVEDGFLGIECNLNAVSKDKAGNLWFGTTGGVTKFNIAGQKQINTIEPKTFITRFQIFYKDTILPQNAVLPYHLNHITFDFIGICFTNPEKVQYQYWLKGAETKWSPATKETKITYSNLRPGRYIFYVKASNNNGVWNATPVSFSFTISPPFWQTYWFYAFCCMVFLIFIYIIYKIRVKNIKKEQIKLEQLVTERTQELQVEKKIVEEKNKIIEEKNLKITDSIDYARNIQEALNPKKEYIEKFIPNSFGLFMPKDIVSGDFAWFAYKEDKIFLAAVDCTGHGVPGAFLSVLGNAALNHIVNEKQIYEPNLILYHLSQEVQSTLHQAGNSTDVLDGMDIALCTIKIEEKHGTYIAKELEYSGAFMPLLVIKDNNKEKKMLEYAADKIAIGGNINKNNKNYKKYSITIEKGDAIYIFSDGITSQIGGVKQKKLSYKKFKEILFQIQDMPMNEQNKYLADFITQWKGSCEQTDDILIIGVKF